MQQTIFIADLIACNKQ